MQAQQCFQSNSILLAIKDRGITVLVDTEANRPYPTERPGKKGCKLIRKTL
jgi:hypothetical protein